MAEMEKKKHITASRGNNDVVSSISPSNAFLLHLICGLGLASALWIADVFYSINLVDHPSETLRLILFIEAPIVILVHSLFRKNPNQCSYLKAVGRGLFGLLPGALANALGAIVLGAPFFWYFPRTLSWSLLMSVLTFVPAACIFGSSWTDWLRIFAHTRPIGSVDYVICLPAHGAIIGAWFGAWPMPLDWERPWQEWPVCVSYGAISGYLVGMAASIGVILFCDLKKPVKSD